MGESAIYIRIESIANIFSLLASFLFICLVTLGKSKYVYIVTGVKLVLCIIFDTFFVSTLSISANLGVNGIGYSNIVVNLFLFIVSVILLSKERYSIFNKEKLSFKWTKGLLKVGGISGAESFVRNVVYMIMISRMVNMVNEQGTWWVANILQFADVDKLFSLVMVLLGFYVLYALQNVFDSEFYGLGKTNYMLFESVVTNTIYYGVAFILYLAGVWKPTLIGIALLFGFGNAFDSIVSGGAYAFLLKKKKINILEVE